MAATRSTRPWYRKRWVVALGGVGLVLVLGPYACQAAWRMRHPAPLGRSAAEVERSLARLLPVGTPLDTAVAVLRTAGADFVVREAADPDVARDAMAAGGPLLLGAARALDADLFTTRGAEIRIAFDSSRRLARRRVEPRLTGW